MCLGQKALFFADMNFLFHLREIGNVHEGIVEGSKDTGDTEDEFTCAKTFQLARCCMLQG